MTRGKLLVKLKRLFPEMRIERSEHPEGAIDFIHSTLRLGRYPGGPDEEDFVLAHEIGHAECLKAGHEHMKVRRGDMSSEEIIRAEACAWRYAVRLRHKRGEALTTMERDHLVGHPMKTFRGYLNVYQRNRRMR